MGERRRDKKQLRATREQTRLQNEWAAQQQAMHAQQMAVLNAQNDMLRRQVAGQVAPPSQAPVPTTVSSQPPPTGPPVSAAPPAGNTSPEVPAAWYPDPSGRHALRWWGGFNWAADVKDAGVQTVDPLPPPT